MYEALIVETTQQFGGLISRVVINHNHIKLKVGLLVESAVDSIADGLFAIIHGDNNRGLHLKVLLVEIGLLIERGLYLGTYLNEMGRGYLFHFYLYLAIGRVHVIELFHTRSSRIGFFFRIEALVDVENLSVATQEQAEGIKASMLIRVLAGLLGKGLKQRGFDKPQTTEIEIVANTAREIIDNGVGLASTFYDVVVVGIYHCCIGIDAHV